MNDQEVIDHMIFLPFAAHDTSTLTSLVYHLAKHPEWQQAVYEEIQSQGKDKISYEHLDVLEKTGRYLRKYCECIRLCLRLPAEPSTIANSKVLKFHVMRRRVLCPCILTK